MKFILGLLFCTGLLSAQIKNDYIMIPKIKAGAMFAGQIGHYFTVSAGEGNLHLIKPGYSFLIGIESPVLADFFGSDFSLSVEAGYGEASTGKVHGYGDPEFIVKSLPVMAWANVTTSGILTPFIKIGIGAERSHLLEKYIADNITHINFKGWYFSWGIGGGLSYNAGSYKISIFADLIIKEKGPEKEVAPGIKKNFNFRQTVTISGIEFGYAI